MICFSDTRKCTVIFSVSLDLLFGSFFSIKRKERTLWGCGVITEAIYSRITPHSSFPCKIACSPNRPTGPSFLSREKKERSGGLELSPTPYIPASSSTNSPLIFGQENNPKPGSTYGSIFPIKRKERTLNSSMIDWQFHPSIFSCSPKRKWTKREGRPTKPASDFVGSGFEGGFMLSEFFVLPQVNQSSPIHLRMTTNLPIRTKPESTYGKNDD